MYIAVAVALVAVAVGVANRSAIGKQVPLGSVVVSRGISTHGIMIIEVVTDSATVNVMGPTLVPSGAIAFMVYRDRDRFLVANRITYVDVS